MGINPIQNVIPTQNTQNFMQDYLQGLKYGQELQAMQKQNELLKKQELFKQDYATLSQNPSGQGMLNLMVKYPEFAAQLKPVQEAFGTAEKQGELSQLMQLDNALYNNNVDLANTIVDNTIKAFENSGRPTAQLQTIKQLIEKDPTQAAGATSQALAMLLGDKYKTYEEGRTIFLQRGSDVKKAEGQATKAVAEGKTAQVDMEVKIATKAAEIERLRALSEKAKSDADKASIEAKIAEATKDLKILEQENKTKTSGQELIIKTTEANYIEPLKKLEVTKKQLENESEKLDQKLTKAKTQNEYQELKNKKQDFENKIADYNVKINEQTEKVGVAASTASENYRLIDDLMAGGKKLYGDLKGEKGKIIPATGVTSNMLPTLTQKTKEIENQINTFKDKATLIFAPQYAPMFKPMSVDEVNIIKNAASELDPSNSIETNMKILEKAHITLKKAYKNVEKSTGFTKEDANKYSPPSKVKTEKPKNDPFKVF